MRQAFLILATVAFALAMFGFTTIFTVSAMPLGLALMAAAMMF